MTTMSKKKKPNKKLSILLNSKLSKTMNQKQWLDRNSKLYYLPCVLVVQYDHKFMWCASCLQLGSRLLKQ